MSVKIKSDRRLNRQSIILIILLMIGVGIVVLLQTKNSSFNLSGKPRLEKGMKAPGFTLPDLDGNLVNLADHTGNVVLLNIWATWCPPCVEEMPSMEKLHLALKGERFKILAVSIDASGAKVVDPFMKKHKLTFPALIDAKATLKNLYRTTGVPESFIIDGNGTIVEKVIGPADWASPDAIRFFQSLIAKNK